jgi:hypothetical protein
MASNTRFHNDTAALNHLWFESHKNLITSVCIELGHTDQVESMVAKHLGDQMKMKKLKDPNKPKRAKSSYMYFAQEQRAKVTKKLIKKSKDGKASMANVSKELGALWGMLSNKDKKPYQDEANKDRERYKDEMETYNSNH